MILPDRVLGRPGDDRDAVGRRDRADHLAHVLLELALELGSVAALERGL